MKVTFLSGFEKDLSHTRDKMLAQIILDCIDINYSKVKLIKLVIIPAKNYSLMEILQAIKKIEKNPAYAGENIYFKGNAALTICSILKNTN